MLRHVATFTLALTGISAAHADGLTPVGSASADVRLCYASGSTGPQVPCVYQNPTWVQLMRPTDDVANTTSTAGDNTRARLLKDRAADTLNLLDFVPQGVSEADILSGVADAAPAFQAAINSRSAGSKVTLIVPYGNYRLNSDVSENGREVHVDMSSGAVAGTNYSGTLGSGKIGAHRVVFRANGTLASETQGTGNATNRAFAKVDYVSNNGGESGIGSLFSYGNYNLDNGTLGNGGDISQFSLSRWYQMTGSGFVSWDVGISPMNVPYDDKWGAATSFALVGKEINLVHNGPVGQWTEYDSSQTGIDKGVPAWSSVGIQLVPDAWTEPGSQRSRKGGHNTVGFMVGWDPFINDRKDGPGGQAYNNGTFSPFHIGNNAVAPGGRGMYYGGSTLSDPAKLPYAGIEVRHMWPMFLNLEYAELTSGWIVNAKPGQSYRWSTPAGDVTIGATAAGKLAITAPGGIDLPATAWTAYTPSQTGAGSGSIAQLGAVSGRYQIAGKRLDISVTVPITTNGTGGAYVYTALPSGLLPRGDCVLTGAEMVNVTSKGLFGRLTEGSGIVAIFNADATYLGADGARLTVNGSCEIQ